MKTILLTVWLATSSALPANPNPVASRSSSQPLPSAGVLSAPSSRRNDVRFQDDQRLRANEAQIKAYNDRLDAEMAEAAAKAQAAREAAYTDKVEGARPPLVAGSPTLGTKHPAAELEVMKAEKKGLQQRRVNTHRRIDGLEKAGNQQVATASGLRGSTPQAQRWINRLRGHVVLQAVAGQGGTTLQRHDFRADGSYVVAVEAVFPAGATGSVAQNGGVSRGRWQVNDQVGQVFVVTVLSNGAVRSMRIDEAGGQLYLNGQLAVILN